jgi:DNA-directed RNA polymerase subunit RPC12/RpoP
MKENYGDFQATELYCPRCKRAVKVRSSLLLVLPEGDKYDYRCSICGEPIGDKLDKSGGLYRHKERQY